MKSIGQASSVTETAVAVKRFTGCFEDATPAARWPHIRCGLTPACRAGRGCVSARSSQTHDTRSAGLAARIRLPNGKRDAPTLRPRRQQRGSSTMRLRSSRRVGQIPTFMALAQRRGSEMAQGNRLAVFGLIRESLKCTRAPAYVGFCLNPMDPDRERAPMGLHAWPPSRVPARSDASDCLDARVTPLRGASGYPQTAGSEPLRQALPTSAQRGERR